jgi:hypothetical protein
VFTEWARLDAEGYVSYLESTVELPSEATGGIQYLLAANPELIERIAGSFPADLGRSIRAAALNALANSDPETARARAESLPAGPERDMALQAVASALVETDPEAALEWARNLSPPSQNALRSITLALARQDPRRLLAMLDDPAPGVEPQLLLVVATSLDTSDPSQLPTLADGLLGRSDAQSAQALQRLVGNWMQRDPETALDWVLAHGTEFDANVLASAAQTLAARDPVAAAAYLGRIPPSQQSAWITQVAGQYGRSDPYGAMAWVAQFQGQDTYEVAVRQVIANAAQTDAYAASQMLSQASATVQFGASQPVAAALAQQDPRAAVRWAESLSDARARSSATAVVAVTWYNSDPNGARTYVLDLPGGADRDQLLGNLVQRSAGSGNFDRELIRGFESDVARQQAVSTAILLISRNDPAQAQALLLREVAVPADRARIEAQIQERGSR